MSVFLQPIYTQTVGGTSVASVVFNNIPQTFTDLTIFISARCSGAGAFQQMSVQFNADTSSLYSNTRLWAYSGTASARGSGTASTLNWTTGSTATANTFGSGNIYIPNYTSSNFKSFVTDLISENSSTSEAVTGTQAGLYRSTTAISSVTLFAESNFVQYSTFTLYGITKG